MNTATQLISAIRTLDEPEWEVHQAFSWDSYNGEWFIGMVHAETDEVRSFIVSSVGIEEVTDQHEARIRVEDKELVEV